ncbi:MAG: NYN domain-containing protein [Mycobacteriaceae bacterium]
MSDSSMDLELSPEWLPPVVKDRLARIVGDALPALAATDVALELRHLVRFTPAKRRSLGAAIMVAAVCAQPRFRAALVDQLRTGAPEVLDLESPDRVGAAAAGVLRADPRVRELVAEAGDLDELRSVHRELSAVRRSLRRAETRCDRLVAELAAQTASVAEQDSAPEREADRLRARLREQGQRLREATDAAAELAAGGQNGSEDAVRELATVRADWDKDRARLSAERARAERAEGERDNARQAAREAREADEVRLGLLLDTLTGVTHGLRSELGISPHSGQRGALPADRVVKGAWRPRLPGNRLDAVGTLNRALALSEVHLIVDGYNVTKAGYPQLTLVAQRDRLVRDLGLLAAQYTAEVTVVFDGDQVVAAGGQVWARGIRVVFSAAGLIADDVIRELVSAEPEGRPVVVASSDREVAESVLALGAHSVASAVLLSRLVR